MRSDNFKKQCMRTMVLSNNESITFSSNITEADLEFPMLDRTVNFME